jgi:hypothetical protein
MIMLTFLWRFKGDDQRYSTLLSPGPHRFPPDYLANSSIEGKVTNPDKGLWLIRAKFITGPYLVDGVCHSAFCCCDKMPEQINLKKERLTLTYSFIGISPLLAGSIVFRLWQNRNIMVEGHGRGMLLISWHPGSRDTERKVQGPYTHQRHTPSHTLPLTRSHLLIAYSAMNSSMD